MNTWSIEKIPTNELEKIETVRNKGHYAYVTKNPNEDPVGWVYGCPFFNREEGKFTKQYVDSDVVSRRINIPELFLDGPWLVGPFNDVRLMIKSNDLL